MSTVPAASPPQDALLRRFSLSLPVERVRSDEVGELCDFFQRAYADQPLAEGFRDRSLVERRWRWLYERSPGPMEGGPPAWVCRHRHRIVGHLGLLPAEAVVGGRPTPVAWVRDLIVAAEARSLGVGALLVLAAREAAGRPLLVAGMNEQSASLFHRLGFRDAGTLPVYVRLYEPSRVLETLSWSPLRRRLAGAAIRAGQSVGRLAGLVGRGKDGVEVVPLDRFDERFDRWWADIEPRLPCVIRRTAETMRWRYEEHPSHRYERLMARTGAQTRGVAVLRLGRSRGLPAGFLTEVLARPEDHAAIDALIAEAERRLTGTPGDRPAFLRCTVRQPAVERRLGRAGFLKAPSPVRWMVSAGGEGMSGAGVEAPERWVLNGGDSDLDVF